MATQSALAHPLPSIVLWGREHVQLYNDAYRVLMGEKHPTGLGQRTQECWPEVWHINAPIYERVWQGESLAFEDALYPVARAGRLEDAWFTLSYSPIRDDVGEVAGVLVTVVETTQRQRTESALRESEERFRAVQDASPDGSVLMRPERDPASGAITDFTFVYANSAATRLLGPSGHGLVGRRLREVYPDVPTNGYLTGYVRAFDEGVPFVILEDYTPYGNPVALEMTAVRAGELVHARFADVTAINAARTERDRLHARELIARGEADAARQVAEAANRAKSEFLAVMSHELRTPLNAIGGYAELMEMGIRGPVTEAQREDLGRIQRAQRHLLGMVNDVLNYTKLGTGTVQYHVAAVSLRPVIAEAAALVAPQAHAKAISLNVDLHASSDSADVSVLADREKLRQVLVNLLANAVKFTERGGQIVVACAVDDDGRRARIAVRDSGIGIPATQLSAIFEPFVQVRSALTRTADGTGLGLAISRDLARGMAGDLTVESRLGEGSTFTVTLPRVVPCAAPKDQ
jgi:signal transduction histidine kinase